MDEYTKLPVSLRERLLFLFTGLIKRSHIISKTVKIEVDRHQEDKTVGPDLTNTPEKIEDIPFFDLDKSETKSNL